jgi:AraC family transcriptional regulator
VASPLQRYSPTCFPAPVVRSRAAGDFLLSETRYASEASLPTHAHEYAGLVVVLDGSLEEDQGGTRRTAQAGTVFVRPEGEPHSNRFAKGGGRCLNVEFSPAWLGRSRDVPVGSAVSYAEFALDGRRLHLELLHGDDVSAIQVESLVLAILLGCAREQRGSSTSKPRWLLRVKERLQDDPAARVTLAQLAADSGVHPVHLATTFRRCFGQTVATSIRRLRIELACRRLAGTEAAIADIAIDAGFADQSHLGRVFKRALRTTPAAYRAALRPVPTP